MSINIAEWNLPSGGEIRIEISNNETFLKRVKEINREQHVRRPKKVRVLGDERVPAEIQRLIDKTEDEPESPLADVVSEDNHIKVDALAPANPEYAEKHTAEVKAQQVETADTHKASGNEVPHKPVRRAVRARPGGNL